MKWSWTLSLLGRAGRTTPGGADGAAMCSGGFYSLSQPVIASSECIPALEPTGCWA